VVIGGSVVLAKPRTDAARVVTVGEDPLSLAIDARVGHAFVVNLNNSHTTGTVTMLDATDGTVRRTVPVGYFPRGIIVDEGRERAFVVTSVADGLPMKASVSVLDTRDGQIRRTITLTNSPSFAVLDTHDGRVLRTLTAGGFASSAMAVDTRGGHMFVVTVAGSGRSCATPGGVCHMPGVVTMRDTRDGRALRSVSVGDNPSTIVVDERTRRVFVVNKGTNEGDIGTVNVFDAQKVL